MYRSVSVSISTRAELRSKKKKKSYHTETGCAFQKVLQTFIQHAFVGSHSESANCLQRRGIFQVLWWKMQTVRCKLRHQNLRLCKQHREASDHDCDFYKCRAGHLKFKHASRCQCCSSACHVGLIIRKRLQNKHRTRFEWRTNWFNFLNQIFAHRDSKTSLWPSLWPKQLWSGVAAFGQSKQKQSLGFMN